jgi:phosphopantothenoylcysteine decarboxylase / phosphopantothenate---cysteine ligase
VARILVGVSGGIAAYKAVELVRLATGAGHAVRVIQTPTSLRFVGRATFEGVTGAPALNDEFEPDPARGAFPGDPVPQHDPISHLELVRRCDVLCVAPASANTIAKLAHGLADNLLTSAALACTAPVVIAPAMNNHMYEHAATRENLETLRRRGARIVDPGEGRLASQGEWGVGRLAEPVELLAAIEGAIGGGRRARGTGLGPDRSEGFTPRSLDGMRVLVTAGGTREPIDSVRYVGNRSSGRMGLALAAEAARRGAQVTAVCANVSLPRPEGVESVDVETAAELLDAASRRFEDADVLLMAAAVGDFRPASALDNKITKTGLDGLTLELEPTEDVLARLAEQRRPGQILIGFAAEHGEGGVERGRDKLKRKGLDAVVVNDISRSDIGFDAAENEVTIVTARGERPVERGSKAAIAAAILDQVERLRTGADAPSTVEGER